MWKDDQLGEMGSDTVKREDVIEEDVVGMIKVEDMVGTVKVEDMVRAMGLKR